MAKSTQHRVFVLKTVLKPVFTPLCLVAKQRAPAGMLRRLCIHKMESNREEMKMGRELLRPHYFPLSNSIEMPVLTNCTSLQSNISL